MKFYIFILLIIFFTSCRLILGIKDPKPETIKTLNSYLLKHDIDTLNCYAFVEHCFDSLSKLPYKPNWPAGFRAIQFKAFDESGKLVSQYASCQGSWKKRKVFLSYPPRQIGWLDSTMSLSKDLQMYRTYYGQKVNLESGFDLTFIVYWTSSLGIINKNLVKAIYKYQKKYSDKKINIIKVNVAEYFLQK